MKLNVVYIMLCCLSYIYILKNSVAFLRYTYLFFVYNSYMKIIRAKYNIFDEKNKLII